MCNCNGNITKSGNCGECGDTDPCGSPKEICQDEQSSTPIIIGEFGVPNLQTVTNVGNTTTHTLIHAPAQFDWESATLGQVKALIPKVQDGMEILLRFFEGNVEWRYDMEDEELYPWTFLYRPVVSPYPVAISVVGDKKKVITITLSNNTTISGTFDDYYSEQEFDPDNPGSGGLIFTYLAGDGLGVDVDRETTPQDPTVTYFARLGFGLGFDNEGRIALITATPYTSPTADLTNVSAQYEAGTVLTSLALNISFNQQDAGPANNFSLQHSIQNAAFSQISNTQNTNLTNLEIIRGTMRYRGTVSYDEGPTKNNNLGTPDPTGKIMEGSVDTPIRTILGSLLIFFGNSSVIPSNSGEVRALPQNGFDTNTSLTLVTGTSNLNQVIAIPVEKTLVKVIDIINLSLDVTDQYLLVNPSVTVNDIGGTPRDYKIYAMTTAIPYSPSANHLITIN
jgi:hypothetical protein